ncbi:hypothetical protein ACXIUS_19525 [Bosea thiooxidans]
MIAARFDGSGVSQSPVTAPSAVTPDAGETEQSVYRAVLHPAFDAYRAARDRYPPPAEAELVTLWKKGRRVVMSVTANGKTNDFYMPPARLVYLLREVAEQLAENALIQ